MHFFIIDFFSLQEIEKKKLYKLVLKKTKPYKLYKQIKANELKEINKKIEFAPEVATLVGDMFDLVNVILFV